MLNNIIAMLICIIFSAYFSATETAFSSFNKTRIRALAEGGSRRAALVLKLSENYDRLLSTILIGNNIVNIAVASIGTVMFIRLLHDEKAGTTVSTVFVTVVVLIFGEISPKSLAKDFPEQFALFSAPLLNLIIKLFTPLNFLFSKWKLLLAKLFHQKSREKMSREELYLLLHELEQESAIDMDEKTLMRNVVALSSRTAQDILTPRTDIVGIPVSASRDEAEKILSECSYSRLPVYSKNLDNIVGILHRTDFYSRVRNADVPLSEIMSPPLFILRTEKSDRLLKLLLSEKVHLAVVADEFGGTLGIVSLEDILEELVGEIWDEHDVVKEAVRAVGDNVYEVSGSWSLEEFSRMFSVEPQADSLSVGGWVTEALGKIPVVGDSFEYDRLKITVCSSSRQRVYCIRVSTH